MENVFENLEGVLIIRLIGYLIGYIKHDVVLYNYIFYGVFHLGGWDFFGDFHLNSCCMGFYKK